MSRICILIFLSSFLVQNSSQEDKVDCTSGQFYDQDTKNCKMCDFTSGTYYSEDGAEECKLCPDNGANCICDTTSPVHYLPEGSNISKLEKFCFTEDNQLMCSQDCYIHSRHALKGCDINCDEEINILDCNCDNNIRTKESCLKRKNFTKVCFQNECDGTRYYDEVLGPELLATLDSCYSQYRANSTCSKSECAQVLLPYLTDLQTCNCYHTYTFTNQVSDGTADCEGRRDFFILMETLCTDEPPHTSLTVIIIIIVGVFLTIGILLVGRLCAVNYGRKLKKSGNIGKIIRFVDWQKITPLGAAGFVYQQEINKCSTKNFNANMLHNKEILLRVQFNLLGGFGIQSQHFVLKIFSESQSEQQGIELGIFNSISDKEKANKSNIIAVYGPPMNADNSDLTRFLETLIEKSKTCAALKDVIEKNYIGIRDKIETPRCKYIMMNYCNELSLTELIKTRRLTLDLAKDLAKDLAQALEYLHEVNEPTIVHCDVKPDNIFVKSRKKTSFILGDFGFAERYENQTFTLRGSTPSYVPPEWYLGHLDTQISDTADPLELQLRNDRVSELQKRLFRERSERPCKIDIYSYGLIIWLALHNKTEPWTEESSSDWKQYLHDHNQNQNKHRNRSSKEIFLRNLFNDPDKFGTRPTCREDTVLNNNPESKLLFELAKDCWQVDSGLRPSSSEILQKDLFRGKSRRYHNQDIIV